MKGNPLLKIQDLGQSVWLDFLRRKMIDSGELKELIEQDGLLGITSNPKIFDKVIAGSHDYDDHIRALALEARRPREIYEELAVQDVRDAADLLRPVFDASGGQAGFVSLEVNPHLDRNVQGTITEARRLGQKLDCPNVFIKVPATRQRLKCIRRLTGEGVNVKVTLLFGLPRYREVAKAYISGLADRAKEGIEKFNRPYDDLMASLDKKQSAALEERVDPQRRHLGEYEAAVQDRLRRMDESAFSRRLWSKDATPWSGAEAVVVRSALGWPHVAEKMGGGIPRVDLREDAGRCIARLREAVQGALFAPPEGETP